MRRHDLNSFEKHVRDEHRAGAGGAAITWEVMRFVTASGSMVHANSTSTRHPSSAAPSDNCSVTGGFWGAAAFDITRLVLLQASAIASVGLAVGTVAALAFARTLSSLLFYVQPWDPATLASAAALLAAATMAASYLPARRAARVDPVTALAAE